MDKLEKQTTVSLKNLDISFLLGLKLFALGLAIDIDGKDEYYISVSIGLLALNINFCWLKPKNNG